MSNETLSEGNAPQGAHRRPQTPKMISGKLLEWMEEEGLDYNRAADALYISNSSLVAIINGRAITDDLRSHLADYVPGITYP